MTNPEHIRDAYLHVARVDHYLVYVRVDDFSLAELEAAEQLLIAAENNTVGDETIRLALDLCEADTRTKRQAHSEVDEAQSDFEARSLRGW